jgi:hypothetical protein
LKGLTFLNLFRLEIVNVISLSREKTFNSTASSSNFFSLYFNSARCVATS